MTTSTQHCGTAVQINLCIADLFVDTAELFQIIFQKYDSLPLG